MEAHGFVFARMNATGNSADALFTNQEAADLPPWHLTLRHSADDDLTVLLTKSAADRDQISLSILVGTETAKTLAEGVGLAVSFVAFSDQLAASV
jgi:hypothetical protein